MEEHPLQKIAISGPTLASLIQRVSSSPGDVDGLLFGHITQITHSTLTDDTSSSSHHLIATITSFLSSTTTLSFYDPLGHNLRLLPHHLHHHNHHHLLGWFSARRKTPLRPSMREFSVTSSLSSKPHLSFPITNSQQPPANSAPSLFLLLTTPLQNQQIHTHEYRAFQFSHSAHRFEPKSIDVINIGPAFRGHYGNFTPKSDFPLLSCEMMMMMRSSCSSSSSTAMNEDRNEEESLRYMKQSVKDQEELDLCAEGFEVRNLSRLVGPEAANYTGGLEDLYEKMLAKIDSLARLVETSSAKILEQEDYNRVLKNKVAKPIGDKNPIL